MLKEYEIGGYVQHITIEKKKVIDVSCTCKWATINRDAWKKTKTLCWHVKTAIANQRRQNEGPNRKISG